MKDSEEWFNYDEFVAAGWVPCKEVLVVYCKDCSWEGGSLETAKIHPEGDPDPTAERLACPVCLKDTIEIKTTPDGKWVWIKPS